MGDGAGFGIGETAGIGGFGGAGGGLPQQVAVHAGEHTGLQLVPQGKASRFTVKKKYFSGNSDGVLNKRMLLLICMKKGQWQPSLFFSCWHALLKFIKCYVNCDSF